METNKNATNNKNTNILSNMVFAGVASAAGAAVYYPIQNLNYAWMKEGILAESDYPFGDLKDAVRKTSKVKGNLYFWNGYKNYLLFSSPRHIIRFPLHDYLKHKFNNNNDNDNDNNKNNVLANFGAGAISGASVALFGHPIDMINLTLRKDERETKGTGKRTFQNRMDVLKKEGIMKQYKFFGINGVATMMHNGFYFGLYDSLSPLIVSPVEKYYLLPTVSSFILGYGITVASLKVHGAFDRIRFRMIISDKYSSYYECFSHVARNEGMRGFFRGGIGVDRALRGAIALTVYYRLQTLLSSGQ